jgi:SAM-dependent methyltransferase
LMQQHFSLRPASPPVLPIRLSSSQTAPSPGMMGRLKSLMDSAEIPVEARPGMINDFAWETQRIPPGRDNLLVIGCGDGIELLFLRATLPEAEITAVDYADSLTPALKKAVGLNLIAGDMKAILAGFEQKFSLVFSNHTLEHLYTPDSMLALLFSLLSQDGVLLSTLPMDAAPGVPFVDLLTEFAGRGQLHPVEVVYLNGGHPWKTNPSDLDATFKAAGFRKVELFQRAEHLSRYFAGSEEQFQEKKDRGVRLNSLIFGNARRVLKFLFPREPPVLLVRVLLAAERRTWFGVNPLTSVFSPEACVVAYK